MHWMHEVNLIFEAEVPLLATAVQFLVVCSLTKYTSDVILRTSLVLD